MKTGKTIIKKGEFKVTVGIMEATQDSIVVATVASSPDALSSVNAIPGENFVEFIGATAADEDATINYVIF